MRGFPPGAHRKGGEVSAAVHIDRAREFYAALLPFVADFRRQGLSLRAIALELQRQGLKTRQEWPHWSATQVRRVLARAAAADQKLSA